MKIHTYDEAKTYLETFVLESSYKRIIKTVSDPLDRMRYLLSLLGNPHEKFKSVIVTGTSGKGSTAYLLSTILTVSGYKTGLTISPHLQKLTERLQINNQAIGDEMFLDLLREMIPAIERMENSEWGKPSYYEILLSLAFLYFAKEQVDIAVVEVGLEGRYDGTNVLDPLLVILTNISLDHTEILGDTEEKIAQEAFYAIRQHKDKRHSPVVVTGIKQPVLREMLEKRCQAEHVTTLSVLVEDFFCKVLKEGVHETVFKFSDDVCMGENYTLSLTGSYQAYNASLAIEAAWLLPLLRKPSFGTREIGEALASTYVPGRFEVFQYKERVIVLDGAHNDAKMKAFTTALSHLYQGRRKIVILAFKKDKDISAMLKSVLPLATDIIVTAFQGMTDMQKNASAEGEKIREQVITAGFPESQTYSAKNLTDAVKKAVSLTKGTDLIVITGSLYLVGEARDFFKE